jgi:hypothetical protein
MKYRRFFGGPQTNKEAIMTRFKSVLDALLLLTLFALAHRQLEAQGSSPLAGGLWDRYSIKNAQGVETGSAGWFFLTFTADGHYLITGVPRGKERLPKGTSDMTKEELVRHLEGIQVRRGRYALTGNGSPYLLTLTDEVNPHSPNLQGSCPATAPCEIRIVNDEVNLYSPSNGIRTQWRRVPGRGPVGR